MSYEQQYLNLCQRILDEGVWVENERTGKRCLTVINADFVYTPDDAPLLTVKQCFPVSAVAEMLGYLRGYDNAQQFADIGSKTWFKNANETEAWLSNPFRKGVNDLGRIYQFSKNGIYIDTGKVLMEKPEELKKIKVNDLMDIDVNELDPLIGQTFESKTSGDFVVLKFLKSSEDKRIKYYKIQFLDTGHLVTVQKSQIRNGTTIKDPYARSVYGIGYVGMFQNDESCEYIKKTWVHMIERCYDAKSVFYHRYGGRGVFVCDEWHCFETFQRDVKNIDGWFLKKEFTKEYTLDKDWCNSNVYSPETCKWASIHEQTRNTTNVKTYLIKEGDLETRIKGLEGLADYFGVGEAKAFNMSKDIELDNESSIVYIEIDQLKSIYAKLRNNIDDRGLIMSAWNSAFDSYACLKPCMYSHHFSLIGDTLHLHSTQRSCDVPLGLNFNSIQCYFLLKLMAKITGHKMGNCYHKIVNAHIYEDQVDGVKEMLSRKLLPYRGTIEIPEWIEDLDDVVGIDVFDRHAREYIEVKNYYHLGKINFEMAA